MTTYIIATPPSVNAMFYNAPEGKGRRKTRQYAAYLRGESKALLAQRAKPIEGRVKITVTLPKNTRGDPDNRLKGAADLLVKCGVLKDDSKKYVASITACYSENVTDQMTRIEVVPCE